MKKQCILAALSILALVTTTLQAEWNPFKRQDKERKIQVRKAMIATALLISSGAIVLEVLNYTGHVKAGNVPLQLSLLASALVHAAFNKSRYLCTYVPVYTTYPQPIIPLFPVHIQFNF